MCRPLGANGSMIWHHLPGTPGTTGRGAYINGLDMIPPRRGGRVDPGILPAIAGIGMSFAGFVGLFGALRQRTGTWSPLEIHMITGIVASGLGTVIFALAPIPLAGLFGTTDVIRVAAAGLTVFSVAMGVRQTRAGRRLAPEQRGRGLMFLLVGVMVLIVLSATIYTGRVELYELSLLVGLLVPIINFSFVVTELGAASSV